MKRHLFAALVGTLVLSGIVLGQEAADAPPPAASRSGWGRSVEVNVAEYTERLTKLAERFAQMEAEFAKGLPPRDWKIEVVPTEKMPLRGGLELLERKYVARITLWPAGIDPTDNASKLKFSESYHALRQLRELIDLEAIGAGGTTSPLILTWPPLREPGYVHFRELAKRCPENSLPQPEIVKFLSSADSTRDVVVSAGNIAQWEFKILATTAEEAEARAQTIVQLVDCGFLRPSQEACLTHGRKHLKMAQAALAEIVKIDEAIEAENKLLAVPSEISADILTQLKSQKVMIAIEEAGLSARVKACDAMLSDAKKLELSTLQSVSDMKVKAEIERVGLKEKLDQINKFIGEGDERRRRQMNVLQLGATHDRQGRELRREESFAAQLADLFELYAPHQIPGNKFTVGPIEWTAADGQ